MKNFLLPLLLLLFTTVTAQNKKPLNHSVYDSWQSIGERLISNDGHYIVYAVNPQEGDGELVIQNPETKYKKVIPRGYNATITEDSRYVIFKIKPFFKDNRQAKIKKTKPDDMPKDSLGIIELGFEEIVKVPQLKSFKTPEKAAGFVAYLIDKPVLESSKKAKAINNDADKLKIDMLIKLADSIINKSIDSIKGNITKEALIKETQKAAKQIIKKSNDDLGIEEIDFLFADGDEPSSSKSVGSDLVIRNLETKKEQIFRSVSDYLFDKKGTKLLIETAKNIKDSNSSSMVMLYNLSNQKTDTISKGLNDSKNFIFDEEGYQLAFVAERDSSAMALQKFYKLWYYTNGQDSATLIAEKNAVGMKVGSTVSENAILTFSKDGHKLFFGTAAIAAPKDTTLVDFEMAKLDIWNYKDDYLQPQQLKQLPNELKRSYTAVINLGQNKIVQLGDEDAERVTLVNEGNASWVLAETNNGNRVEGQWTGRTKTTAYIINTNDGTKKLVMANSIANFNASPAGNYVYWFDPVKQHYFTYNVTSAIINNVTEIIKVPLYHEDNDVPDYARQYGVMGWSNADKNFYVYDKFEVWDINPDGANSPITLIDAKQAPRKNKITYRYINTDSEERFINTDVFMLFNIFDNNSKMASINKAKNLNGQLSFDNSLQKMAFRFPVKAKKATAYIFTKENYEQSPNLYYSNAVSNDVVLSNINPQQKDYNWGTAELFTWKAYSGKQSEGIIYKPENFNPKKKYPMICYFYEKLSDGLYGYQPPSPTPSRLNIPFFVSRGYIVFVPDISYTTGHPGNDAYNYIVSGARAVVKQGYVDSTKMGLQGQSWGGYQIAYLITKTKLFAAAWAGAPVANMTSAYGGIRWGSGLNRQFQYEKTQSRIGASLWEKPNLYIENSPLFHLPAVTTPLVIMHNDADDAVPWYQGIEMFTAMRRLNKPVWLLVYNGEAHNLIERRNRKDISIRQQQFFDWKLKGEHAAKWLSQGVPATQKGIDWGLEIE